jgi:chemotaxis response regulator CheB
MVAGVESEWSSMSTVLSVSSFRSSVAALGRARKEDGWAALRSASSQVEGFQPEDGKGTIRVIVADTQAIFRAGLRKIFALEDDIRVVGQAESLEQTVAAIQKFSADIVIFEAALAPNPADAVSDLLRQSGACRLVVVLQEPDQEMTLDLFRRGAHAIVSREVEPEMLVECLRKVAQGEPWLERRPSPGCCRPIARKDSVRQGRAPKFRSHPKSRSSFPA